MIVLHQFLKNLEVVIRFWLNSNFTIELINFYSGVGHHIYTLRALPVVNNFFASFFIFIFFLFL